MGYFGRGFILQLLRGLFEGSVHQTRLCIGQDAVAVVFPFRLCPGHFGGDLPGVIQQLAPGDLQELVQLFNPFAHRHRLAVERLELSELDVEVHDPVQRLQLVLVEIVLGDRDVLPANDPAGTGGLQAHSSGCVASARWWITSAAVWPCVAQCILFCTVAKNCWDISVLGL